VKIVGDSVYLTVALVQCAAIDPAWPEAFLLRSDQRPQGAVAGAQLAYHLAQRSPPRFPKAAFEVLGASGGVRANEQNVVEQRGHDHGTEPLSGKKAKQGLYERIVRQYAIFCLFVAIILVVHEFKLFRTRFLISTFLWFIWNCSKCVFKVKKRSCSGFYTVVLYS